MKKTLAALAVLGAFAGSAMAADVTLYGALDTGFEYKPKSRSKPSRYSSENDVLIEKSVKYTDFFLLSIVYV